MIPPVTAFPVLANSGGHRIYYQTPSSSPSLLAQSAPSQANLSITTLSLSVTPTSIMSPVGPSVSTTPAFTSLQSSPEGPRGRNYPYSHPPTPLQLPDPVELPPILSSPSAMNEAVSLNNKGPGLMRRISRGAASRLTRRRQSSNHVTNRDRSSGPVVMRRRSDSKSEVELEMAFSGSGSGPEGEDFDMPDDLKGLQGLGLSGDSMNFIGGSLGPRTKGGIAPIVPLVLRQGTMLTKMTRKKQKSLDFVLDTDSAKVYWNSSNASKQFYIDDIQQIRMQGEARIYREEFLMPVEYERRWFTIIYADRDRAKGRPHKAIHLIAPSQHLFELWTSTLSDLRRYRHELMAGLVGSGSDEKTLRGHWNREMAKIFNGAPHPEYEENLGFPGIESLCRGLHINCSQNVLRTQFDLADTDDAGFLNFREFTDFVRRLKQRSDIKTIYQKLKPDHSDGLDLSSFLIFLQNTQGLDVESNRAYWAKAFARFVRKPDSSSLIAVDGSDESSLHMDLAAFSAFLSSTYNNIQSIKTAETRLDRPLNEYFVSSSHNTYLLGRQVAGNSSIEAYVRALQRACRCVEIDCWDGQDGRPMVLHGRTMTSSIPFLDCIAIIGKHAFEESPYPLILSLEVHCNAEQQQVMVDIMINEFGERLVREPYMINATTLPSPEDLRHRILVKVKAGGDPIGNSSPPAGRRERAFSSPFARPQNLDNANIASGPVPSSPSPMNSSDQSIMRVGSMATTSVSCTTDDSDAAQSTSTTRKKPRKRKGKIIKSLGDLGVYARGVKFNDFSSPDSKTYNHIFSFGERRFESLCRDQADKTQLEKHNMQYLMRIYPSGMRLKSTNPDPLLFWRRGAQMVALNWQTYDLGMQLNDAMFASGTDRFGYVLKPRELRSPDPLQGPTTGSSNLESSKIPRKLIRFSVTMISAQQLPQPRGTKPEEAFKMLNPYIEIEMFSAEDKAKDVASGEGGQDASARDGMSGIGSPHRRRTHVVQGNGYDPIFNDTFNLQLATKYPDLVFVRWTVWDSPDGRGYINNPNSLPLASFTAKLSRLEQGYRHLPLYDHNGDQFLFATLFCKIQKEEPIDTESEDLATIAKMGRFKQFGHFGQSMFKRTLSIERKATKGEDKKGPQRRGEKDS